MHTFFLLCPGPDSDLGRTIDRSARATEAFFKSTGASSRLWFQTLDDCGLGWFCLVPQQRGPESLVSDHIEDQIAVVSFGELADRDVAPARKIAQAFTQQGLEGVRRLDGCFSAVIIERCTKMVHLTSDLIGRRALRFVANRGLLMVSPHDFPLVASGLCPVEIDLVSAASIVSVGWSLQGSSLLKGVESAQAEEEVRWCAGELMRRQQPLLSAGQRIDPADRETLRTQLGEMIDHMRVNTKRFCANAPEVIFDLTAGIDSRAVMGVLLSVAERSRLLASTSGGENSLDVRTARRLSRWYRLRHRSLAPTSPQQAAFERNTELRAFLCNGDTNAKRSFSPAHKYDPDSVPRIHGGGGEIYRGYYYPRMYSSRSINSLSPDRAVAHLQHKFPRVRSLPWASPDLAQSVDDRLRDLVGAYAKSSPLGSDVLDRFYLFERYGRWGAMAARATWIPNRFSPFDSPTLARKAFALPAPICKDFLLHKQSIKHFLPAAYYWRINNGTFLPLLGTSPCRLLLSKSIDRAERRLSEWIAKVSPHRQSLKSTEQLRSGLLSERLQGSLPDLLLADDSVSLQLFNPKGLRQMVQEQASGQRNHLQSLGFLITMETYRLLMLQALRQSRPSEDSPPPPRGD